MRSERRKRATDIYFNQRVKISAVGARIPNVFGIRMVDGCSVLEWFSFRMVFDKMAYICSVFEWFVTKWPPFVWFSNGF